MEIREISEKYAVISQDQKKEEVINKEDAFELARELLDSVYELLIFVDCDESNAIGYIIGQMEK